MKSDFRPSEFGHRTNELFADEIRAVGMAVLVCEDISLRITVGIAKEFAVFFLLLFQLFETQLSCREEVQCAVPAFALRLVLRIDCPIPGHRVADGQFSILIIDRIPFQTPDESPILHFFAAPGVIRVEWTHGHQQMYMRVSITCPRFSRRIGDAGRAIALWAILHGTAHLAIVVDSM